MGKSNNLNSKLATVYQREQNVSHFLKEDAIHILEQINDSFINQFITYFSNLIKNNIRLTSYSMKIESYDSHNNNIKHFRCVNAIDVLPYQNQSVIIFSHNFLSVIIDLLFGGRGNFTDSINIKKNLTSTEMFINKKIMQFFITALSNLFEKYFSSDIKFVNIKVFFDFKKPNVNFSQKLVINYFHLNVNNTEIFFVVLVPLSLIKQMHQKKIISTQNNDQQKCIDQTAENIISLHDIYDVEINIIAKIINISIAYKKLSNLSIGDVLLIKKPEKIIGFIENKPIFLGNYKRFNKQTIVFIDEFINNNLETNKHKEYSSE